MRAVLLESSPRRLRVAEDWPEPEPGPGEVLVQVRGVGICGSDLALVTGKRQPPRFPWLVGHETFGEVVRAGEGVETHRPGQRVVVEPNFPCFTCLACASGRTSACQRRQSLGFSVPGTLAERITVPAAFAWPTPPDWDEADAVCAEPLVVARTAIRRAAAALRAGDGTLGPAGDNCLVVGTGSQGVLLCVALAEHKISPGLLEPHQGRRKLAELVGGRPVDPDDRGFDLVFETSGTGAGLDEAIGRAAPGGLVVLIGQSSQPVPVATRTVVQRQLTLLGSLIYEHPGDFAATFAGSSPGAGRVLRASYPMAETPDAFRAARDIPGKTWINVGGSDDD
jgi:alcohol dehydrogenase/L-iditol 2-dehydrogenase